MLGTFRFSQANRCASRIRKHLNIVHQRQHQAEAASMLGIVIVRHQTGGVEIGGKPIALITHVNLQAAPFQTRTGDGEVRVVFAHPAVADGIAARFPNRQQQGLRVFAVPVALAHKRGHGVASRANLLRASGDFQMKARRRKSGRLSSRDKHRGFFSAVSSIHKLFYEK